MREKPTNRMRKLICRLLFITAIMGAHGAETVVFNEIMYRPATNGTAYVELFNTSSNSAVNLSGWQVDGLEYTFPSGAGIAPGGFLVLAKNLTAFYVSYGFSAYAQYPGDLHPDSEMLTLLKPGAPPEVVDRVRYDSVAPWYTNANGLGSSVQVIDPRQENARVGNWFSRYTPPAYCCESSMPLRTNDGWQFFSASGSIGSGESFGVMRLLLYLGESGSAIIDDLAVVAGSTADAGYNYVTNGDFELPLITDPTVTNSWRFGTNYTNSLIINDLVHGGNGALKLIGSSPGAGNVPTYSRAILQVLSPAPVANSTCTLSFWYWATNSATNLYVRIRNSAFLTSGTNGGPTNINIFIVQSNYVPPMLIAPALPSVSPGAANPAPSVPPLPPLWISDVLPENTASLFDSFGEHEPWIKLYNSSTGTVSLAGLFLSPSYTNLTAWPFPGGSIGPTQTLLVFCDGQPAQTVGSEFHTGFRLPVTSGSVALSRLFNGEVQVLDYVNYSGLTANYSLASVPDGQPFFRQIFDRQMSFTPPDLTSVSTGSVVFNPATGFGVLSLTANVNPRGLATTVYLQYGPTAAYGNVTPPVPAGSGTSSAPVAGSWNTVPLSSVWHYRVVATNFAGATNSSDRTVSASPFGDFDGNTVVSQTELDAVYGNYLQTSPFLQMTNVAGLGGTNVTFALSNSLNGAYGVEYSTNLTNWTLLGPARPRYLFTDTNAPANPQRSYRLRWP